MKAQKDPGTALRMEIMRKLCGIYCGIKLETCAVPGSLQLSIFVALVIPLFDEVSLAMGSRTSFDIVMAHAKHLEVGAALSTMKQVLFGTSP